MVGNIYRIFFDDSLLFMRSLIGFTSDLQRVVHKMCNRFDIEFDLLQSFMNFPMIDDIMFKIGEAFSDKFIKVTFSS